MQIDAVSDSVTELIGLIGRHASTKAIEANLDSMFSYNI
jgi:hypothetical protein